MHSMTIASGMQQAAAQGMARLDAQLLMLQALDRAPGDRAWLMAHDQDALPEAAAKRFAELARRRQDGEPVAYLLGYKEFFGLRLNVDARVLDPRPDTETLVEWALELDGLPPTALALDMGTGSGAIALALKATRPLWHVSAVDASADALIVARANAQRLGLSVRFYQGDWFSALAPHARSHEAPAQRFDLIVSNPPYVASADPHLAALRHEPLHALASGPDGLDDIRTLIAQAATHMAPGGWLLLEHGYDQAAAVRGLLSGAGFAGVQSRQDLSGIERCSGGQFPPAD